MLVHRRATPSSIRRYPFIHLGGERPCESKVSCPRTQHMAPARAQIRGASSRVERTNHEATARPHGSFSTVTILMYLEAKLAEKPPNSLTIITMPRGI